MKWTVAVQSALLAAVFGEGRISWTQVRAPTVNGDRLDLGYAVAVLLRQAA